jgi:hypothetical protein
VNVRRSEKEGEDARKPCENMMSFDETNIKLSDGCFGIRCPSATTKELGIFDVIGTRSEHSDYDFTYIARAWL